MKYYIGSDHAGYEAKEVVKAALEARGIDYQDMGTDSSEVSTDFPDFAFAVGENVSADEHALGILVCGSAGGMVVAANKVEGIRAVHAINTESAADARIHDDANVLVLAGRYTPAEEIPSIVEAFISAQFDTAERRVRRVKKITDYEDKHFK